MAKSWKEFPLTPSSSLGICPADHCGYLKGQKYYTQTRSHNDLHSSHREFILMTKKRLQIDPWATDDLSFVFADLPMTSVKQMLRVVYNGTVNARSEKEMAEIQGLLKFFHFKTKEFKSDSEPDDVLQSGEIGNFLCKTIFCVVKHVQE